MAKHNLISFKSLQEPLNDWTLKELTGHYVNYRKQKSPSLKKLIPESDFQLYGVCMRFPQTLSQQISWKPKQDGVYDVSRGTDQIRLIVLSEIPLAERNAIWNLFSGVPEKVQYGATHYHWHSQESSTIMNKLYHNYGLEGVNMPYTMQDYIKDLTKENLSLLNPHERLEGLTPQEILKEFNPKDRMEGLAPKDRMEGLNPKDLIKKLKQDGVSLEEIKKLLGENSG